MRIIRFVDGDGFEHFGSREQDGSVEVLIGSPLNGLERTGTYAKVARLLAPIQPTAILAIGLNYRKHAEETGAKIPEYPILFIKTPNTLQDPYSPILLPTALASEEVDYECELAVVIGKTGKNIPKESALEYVLGYTCANDVSARDWQIKRGGSQWCRGKCFDTFCPLGPSITTADEIPNPNDLTIKTILNGEAVQAWNTNDMIFDVPTLIEFLSGSTTLLAGTAILTGTPQGVGMARKPPVWLKEGDVVSIEIEKIGTLTNAVECEVA
jgi:2-keto-4-pentenoate hydratase/2-oxohepta-3-ene-1,7-dioic acid hydratase in catechol pathway